MTGKIDISPEQLAIVQGILKDHLPKGTLAWAFGSRVTWTAKPFSDLDIALEGTAPLAPEVLIDLEEAFEASDLPWKVDVIDLHAVSPEFRAIVERQRVPADWVETTLGEVTGRGGGSIQTGPFGSQLHASDYKEWGVPVIMPQNISTDRISTDGIARISEEDAERLSKHRVQVGDIVYSRRGDVERRALVRSENEGWLCGTGCLKVRFGSGVVVPEFAAFYLSHPASKAWVVQHAVGATMPNLNTSILSAVPFVLPPIDEQQRIADTLAALDDKIELNRRMNETLEAMARAVFRDWFVDFGPTRRKAAGLTDPAAILGGLLPDPTQAAPLAALFPDRFGEDGLPEGWEERSIADDFDVEMGQSPPGSTYNEEGEGLPFFQGRRDFQFRFPEKRVYCSAPTRIAQADWTLISVRAPVGDINRAWEKCCIGRGVGAMMHKKGWASFTYYVGLHLQTELASYDKDGTVFGSINQKQLKGLSLSGTNSSAAKAFDDLIAPMDAMIRNNTAENQTLAATRDLLLPKLMSGEIRLTGAEGVV